MFFIFISQEHDHEVCLNFDIVVPYDNDIDDVTLWLRAVTKENPFVKTMYMRTMTKNTLH